MNQNVDSMSIFVTKNGYLVRVATWATPEADDGHEFDDKPKYGVGIEGPHGPMGMMPMPKSMLAGLQAEVKLTRSVHYDLEGMLAAVQLGLRVVKATPALSPGMVPGMAPRGGFVMPWASAIKVESGFLFEVCPIEHDSDGAHDNDDDDNAYEDGGDDEPKIADENKIAQQLARRRLNGHGRHFHRHDLYVFKDAADLLTRLRVLTPAVES